uniref:Uncharacterized protein n=1 Tax=Trichuris muris TaxID=70415 RepID=A0A5S6Q9M1_TRIMR
MESPIFTDVDTDDVYEGEEDVKYYNDGLYPASALSKLPDTVTFYRTMLIKRVLPWAVLSGGAVFSLQLLAFVLLWRFIIAYGLLDFDVFFGAFTIRTLWFYSITVLLYVPFCWHTLTNFRCSYRIKPLSFKSALLNSLKTYPWGLLLDTVCSVIIGNLFFGRITPAIRLDQDLLWYVSALSSVILMASAVTMDHYFVDLGICYDLVTLFSPSLFISIVKMAAIIWMVLMPLYFVVVQRTWTDCFCKLFLHSQSYSFFVVILANCYRRITLVWMCKRTLLQTDFFMVSNRYKSDPRTTRLWIHIALEDERTPMLKHLAFAKLARIAFGRFECDKLLLSGRWGSNWSVWNPVREACIEEMFNLANDLNKEHNSLYERVFSSKGIREVQYHHALDNLMYSSPSGVWSSSADSRLEDDDDDLVKVELGTSKTEYDWNIWTNYQIVIWCMRILGGAVCIGHSIRDSVDVHPYMTLILSRFFNLMRELRKHRRLLRDATVDNSCRTIIARLCVAVYLEALARLRNIKNVYGDSLKPFIRSEEDSFVIEST